MKHWKLASREIICLNYLQLTSHIPNHCLHVLQWVKQVRYVCVVHVMQHIIISFMPFKKPLAKEIVAKRSRSLAPCAKLLGFQRWFLNTKNVASKEEPIVKMSTMSLWNNWLSSFNPINKCTIRCNINWNGYEVV